MADETTPTIKEQPPLETRTVGDALVSANASGYVPVHQVAEADGENFLWVKSGRSDNKTALFEKDPRHPVNGEAFVATEAPTLVFMTKKVSEALRHGVIIECGPPETENKIPRTAPTPPAPERRRKGGGKTPK